MTTTNALPITQSRLELGVQERLLFCGAQLYVSVAGETVFDEAFGLARPGVAATPDTLFPTWCTAKPVLALAVLRACDQGGFDLDRALGDYATALRDAPIGSVTTREVMTHRSGLPSWFVLPGTFASEEQLVEALRSLPLDPPQDGVRYSPSWGFYAVAVALRAAGADLAHSIRSEVLDPLGIADIVLPLDEQAYERQRHRFGINWMQTRDVLRPVAIDGLDLGGVPDLAMGSYTSARALGRFYEAVRAGRAVDAGVVSEASFEAMTTPAGPRADDPTQQRTCTYGLGTMVQMADHGFGDACSPASYGHSGGTGFMLAFADPADDLVVAAVFPSLEAGELLTISSRRPHLIQTIRQELGLRR